MKSISHLNFVFDGVFRIFLAINLSTLHEYEYYEKQKIYNKNLFKHNNLFFIYSIFIFISNYLIFLKHKTNKTRNNNLFENIRLKTQKKTHLSI